LQEGGPIGLVQNGDKITIDVVKRVIDVDLSEEQLDERRRKWSLPEYKANRGALWKVQYLRVGHFSFNSTLIMLYMICFSCIFSVHKACGSGVEGVCHR
jgi:hypothetical protein